MGTNLAKERKLKALQQSEQDVKDEAKRVREAALKIRQGALGGAGAASRMDHANPNDIPVNTSNFSGTTFDAQAAASSSSAARPPQPSAVDMLPEIGRQRQDLSALDEETRRYRDEIVQESRREVERQFRMERAKKKDGDRDGGAPPTRERDITERVALGMNVARPTPQGEALYDTRLLNRSAGMDSGFAADDKYNLYDKPLFGDKMAASSSSAAFDGDQAGATADSLKTSNFYKVDRQRLEEATRDVTFQREDEINLQDAANTGRAVGIGARADGDGDDDVFGLENMSKRQRRR